MDLKEISNRALESIENSKSLEELEAIRIAFLSKKGEVSLAMSKMKDLPNEEKPLFGKLVNEAKQ